MKKKSESDKNTKNSFHFGVFSVANYVPIFFGIALIVTAAINIFLWDANLDLSREYITFHARLTFASIFLMAFLFTLLIGISRKIRVEKPVKSILKATKKITKGDFSTRIPERKSRFKNEFDEIIGNLNTMASELSGVETLRMDFISNVSHELKTPLAVIQNYATILQDTNLSEENRLEYAAKITEASRRLTTLITNILKLNKLENQQIFPEKTDFDLSEQITESLLNFESVWEEKEIDIKTEIEDGVKICSDPELLSLVWNNLFSNAFKFTPKGGKVTVKLSQTDGKIIVQVRDTGCGMSEETKSHIFEKFYQGDTSHATKGNGLGLALVKRVCDITGAKISVESKESSGSVFTVTCQ
ncbi:ATP-binding protein [Treponema sp.]|uniref:HAMP domain-containing sensor histidine kinase n=1 Tax=Treponema sp. TaxID=166 RepID=UPI00388E53CB